MPRRLLPALLGGALAVVLAAAPARAQAQGYGTLEGRVTERATGASIPGATVVIAGTNFGTAADGDGRYRLNLPPDRYAVRYSAVGFEARVDTVVVERRRTTTRDVALVESTGELGEVTVQGEGVTRGEAGVSVLDPELIRNTPSPLSDGLRAVKTLFGVTSNNELSYQYSVRGGGYNENLYFIDGFEVYTPFRTKQGEQEGLGIVNPDLTQRMVLYAGGFPARYGGKLASALDVTYARPRENAVTGSGYTSLFDAGAATRIGALDGRLGVAAGVRTAQARALFGSQELKGDYDPRFFDAQLSAAYDLAPGHTLSALGILARNRFALTPTTRTTTFGSFQNLRSVTYAYEGTEEDGYDLGFAGLRLANQFGGVRLEHDVSLFDVVETEQYDIRGAASIFLIPDPLGNPNSELPTGSAGQRDFADNRVQVTTLTANGRYGLGLGSHAAEAGWTARRLRFSDHLDEGSVISGNRFNEAGIPVPVEVTTDALRDDLAFAEWQVGGYVQDAYEVYGPGVLVVTGGVRADHFTFNGETTFGPRLSALWRVNGQTTASAAAGVYHQAPTYRELRGEAVFDSVGAVGRIALNEDVRSQRATQVVAGVEHFFQRVRLYGRAEVYYKRLDDLISYTVEGVRTVYSGRNDAEGRTAGLDLQLRGEFVPGLESWLNYSFLFSQERFTGGPPPAPGDGASEAERDAYEDALLVYGRLGGGDWVARPFDRRHNVALFVQDYVPGNRSWKLHMRALFGSGTPYTPPEPERNATAEAAGIDIQVPGRRHSARYPEYQRFDMGVTKEARLFPNGLGGRPVTLELTAELLNVFDTANTIAYAYVAEQPRLGSPGGTWNRVPTRLTPRQLNVRLRVNF